MKKDDISQLLMELGLKDRDNHRPNQLFGGEQQRVAIGRALFNRPALLLADEPTGNLDSSSAKEISLLLKRANREFGQTVIFVTHDKSLAQSAQRVVEICDGRIKSDTQVDYNIDQKIKVEREFCEILYS